MHFIHSTRQNHIQTTFFNQLKVIYHSRRHAIFECIFAPGRDNLTNKLFAILHLSSKVLQSSFTLHQYRKIPILLSSNVLHSKDSNSITKLIQNNERRIKNFLTSQTVNQSHGLTKGLFLLKNFIKTPKKLKKAKGTHQFYITLRLDRTSPGLIIVLVKSVQPYNITIEALLPIQL